MDMHSREQYLKELGEEYRRAGKERKTALLYEAARRTRLSRKTLIRKLAHPPVPRLSGRRRRSATYGAEVRTALVRVWEIFEYPCGQRLKAVLAEEVERLRQLGELRCSDRVAGLLRQVSAKTVDRLLAREREVRKLKRSRGAPVHPLLYQRVPVKTAGEWDRGQVGNVQADFVSHSGRSACGEFAQTLSMTDIATSWWEGEPQRGRSQKVTAEGVKAIRQRLPFPIREMHPDNDSSLLNEHLYEYCRKTGIRMSRSRPYQKNDNAWVEQKNWTHIRAVVGYRRYDTAEQVGVLGELYRVLADYKNFFQPAMKLAEKLRVKGKVHRKYDEPRTPYRRLMESGVLSKRAQAELRARYESLNPAELKRRIDTLQDRLFALTETVMEPKERRKPYWPFEFHSQRNRRVRAVAAED